MGLGALVLLALALPTLVGVLRFAGRTFLPYPLIAYGQGIVNWLAVALRTLSEAAWVLCRFAATNPTVQSSLALGAIVGAASVIWMRFVFRTRGPQRQTSR